MFTGQKIWTLSHKSKKLRNNITSACRWLYLYIHRKNMEKSKNCLRVLHMLHAFASTPSCFRWLSSTSPHPPFHACGPLALEPLPGPVAAGLLSTFANTARPRRIRAQSWSHWGNQRLKSLQSQVVPIEKEYLKKFTAGRFSGAHLFDYFWTLFVSSLSATL